MNVALFILNNLQRYLMSHTSAHLKKLTHKILEAKNLILTTHIICDGDGLGASLGLYHALGKINKKVRIVTVDIVPQKYHFLSPKKYTESFDQLKTPIEPTEAALVMDTNDCRRIQPLYDELQKKCKEIIYIDHHPVLQKGPKPSRYSLIDTAAASTGELIYFLIKEMGVSLDSSIATSLYTSILFDTQRFRFIRNSNISYKICADLCPYIKNNEAIYNQLFGITSREKMNLLSHTIRNTEYFYQNKVAILEMSRKELNANKLDIEDACDFLDMILEVDSTQMSILIIHLSKNKYKLSFRSKKWNVSRLAEVFNGGGHTTSSGAVLTNYTKNPKAEILKTLPLFTDLSQD